jgi:hypothetical protein
MDQGAHQTEHEQSKKDHATHDALDRQLEYRVRPVDRDCAGLASARFALCMVGDHACRCSDHITSARHACHLLLVASYTAALVACGSRTGVPIDGGDSGSSRSGESSSGSGSGGIGSSGSSGGIVGGPCPRAGPLQNVNTISDAAVAVVGRWQICTGLNNVLSFNAPSDTVGMEFAQATTGGGYCSQQGSGTCMGGNLYYLVQGSSGLVRGQGFAYELEYELVAIGGLELDLSVAPNGGWTTSIRYSANPRALDITSLGYNSGATMSPVP